MRINIAHSEFPEQKGGIMICGYEWGQSKADQGNLTDLPDTIDRDALCTFANKAARYGSRAASWPYDKRIRKWFRLWGFELNVEHPGPLERSIVQTNWCDTQNPNMNGDYARLNDADPVANFLTHVKHFRPRMILFMGSRLIQALQRPETLVRFQGLMGHVTRPLEFRQKPFDGRRFRIAFQSFADCEIIGLPHPSASQGLSDGYIDLFSTEIGALIAACAGSRLERTTIGG